MSFTEMITRRTVSVPNKVGKDGDVMVLAELGAKILGSKDAFYQEMFYQGYPLVVEVIKDALEKKGMPREEKFKELYEMAYEKQHGKRASKAGTRKVK